jgi:hypothetical protein
MGMFLTKQMNERKTEDTSIFFKLLVSMWTHFDSSDSLKVQTN